MPSTRTEPRIRVDVLLDEADRRTALHDATFWSLRETPKELPAVWLYDRRGSQLFDEITRLPEYYLTRSERQILRAHAAEIAERTAAEILVELGSGTSQKTRVLLDALQAGETLERFVPLDVSEATLRTTAESIAAAYPGVGVHAIVGDFERHLAAVPAGGRRLLAFLGSTIGNLAPHRRARLLRSIASTIGAGDAFLLGIDLVKEVSTIERAYNDPRGLTEAFVRNGLEAVNRELRADFDQAALDFTARWDASDEWVDIGFVARDHQVVTIPELEIDVVLEEGEYLRVEISAKFRRDGLAAEFAAAGLVLTDWWTYARGDFAVALARRR